MPGANKCQNLTLGEQRQAAEPYLCRPVAFPQPIIHENVQRDQERIQLYVVLPLKFTITPL